MRKLFCVLFALAVLGLALSASCEELVLPQGLEEIGEEAFMGDTALESVTVPEGVLRIGDRAFQGTGLTWAVLPGSLEEIGADAFDGCPDLLCVVQAGSPAQLWCQENGVAWTTCPLRPPVMDTATREGNNVFVTWQAVEGAEGYTLLWSETGDLADASSVDAGEDLIAEFYGLAYGTDYTFWVRAYGSGGESPLSAPAAVSLPRRVCRALLVADGVQENEQQSLNDVALFGNVMDNIHNPWGGSYTVTRVSNLDQAGLLQAIRSAYAGATEDDVSLFYIATHGVQDTGDLALQADLMPVSVLAGWLEEYVPGEKIIIIEACSAGSGIYEEPQKGALKARSAGAGDENRALDSFVDNVINAFSAVDSRFAAQAADGGEGGGSTGSLRRNKYYVLAACEHGTLSWYYTDVMESVFTQYLCQAVGTSGPIPADTGYGNSDGLLTLHELYTCIDQETSVAIENGDIPYQAVQVYPSGSAYPLFTR